MWIIPATVEVWFVSAPPAVTVDAAIMSPVETTRFDAVAFMVIALVLLEARETDKITEPKTIVPAFDALAL